MDTATRQQQLDRFLAEQEIQAYKMAYALTRNRDDALDLVQDSMLRLARHYAGRPSHEWKALFYRILNNRIRDFHRSRKLWRWLPLFGSKPEDSGQDTAAPEVGNRITEAEGPDEQLQQRQELQRIHQALSRLPLRQQQVFLMRAWQEFSTTETASALGISEASVKTHYRRARQQLRDSLGQPTGTAA